MGYYPLNSRKVFRLFPDFSQDCRWKQSILALGPKVAETVWLPYGDTQRVHIH